LGHEGLVHLLKNNGFLTIFSLFLILSISLIMINFENVDATSHNARTIILQPIDVADLEELNTWNAVKLESDGTTLTPLTDPDPSTGLPAIVVAVLNDDGDTTLAFSDQNNDLQTFKTDTVTGATQINYINVCAEAKKIYQERKATKYSLGIGNGNEVIAIPNGGVELELDYKQECAHFPKNPWTGKNLKDQDEWDPQILADMAFSPTEKMTFGFEQNTASKEVLVTKFWVEVNGIFPVVINITEINQTATGNSTLFWGDNITIKGTIGGVSEAAGDSVELDILNADGTTSTITATISGDTWQATHTLPDTSGDFEVTAKVVNPSSTEPLATDVEVKTANLHPTSLILLNDQGEIFWGQSILKSGILFDNHTDAGTFYPALVDISGNGTGTLTSPVLTNNTGGFSLSGLSPQLADTLVIDVAFAGDLLYDPASAVSGDDYLNKKHTTTLDPVNDIGGLIYWGEEITKDGYLVDTTLGFEGLGISSQTINLSGNGLGPGCPDSLTTNVNGLFRTNNCHTPPTGFEGWEITVSYDGDDLYEAATDTENNDTDYYDTTQHDTILLLNSVEDIDAGTPITVTGTLIDDTPGFEGQGVPGRQVFFGPFQGGEFPVIIPSTFTIGGITISGNFDIEQTSNCGDFSQVLRLNADDHLTFPANPIFVKLTLCDMSTSKVFTQVIAADGSRFPAKGQGQGDNFGSFDITHGSGVNTISIQNIQGSGDMTIAQITTFNSEHEEISSNTFDQFDDTSYTRLDLGGGNYDALGISDASLEPTQINIEAFFRGDVDYRSYTSTKQIFNIVHQTGLDFSGTGEQTVSVVADSGLGVTSVQCASDNDDDGDALCNDWETTGIPYDVPDSDGIALYQLNSNVNQRDVFVEIDHQTSFAPLSTALDNVSSVFTSITNPITLHNTVDDNNIDDVALVQVWSDSNTNFNDDFNSIKSKWFGTSSERPTIGTTQNQSWQNQVAWLKVDNNLSDSAGSNTGSATGAAYTSGVSGSAYDSTGLNPISLGNSNFNFDTGDEFTLAFWMKAIDIGQQTAMAKFDGSKGMITEINSSGGIQFYLMNAFVSDNLLIISSDTPFTDLGNYHHVVITYDGSSDASGIKIYTDGTLSGQTNYFDNLGTTSSVTNNADFTIGARSDGTFGTSADFDDIRIYPFALNEDQVNDLYNSPNLEPVASYPFELNMDDQVNNADGLVTGTARYTVGADGTAFDFNGATSINLPQSTFAFDRNDPFSISFTMRDFTDSQETVLAKYSSGAGMITEVTASGSIQFYLMNTFASNNILVSSTNPIFDDNNYHDVVITYDGSSDANGVKIYADGSEVNTTVWFDNLSSSIVNSDNITVGSRTDGSFATDADIDNLKLFDYVLSPHQAANVNQATTGQLKTILEIKDVTLTTPGDSNTDPADYSKGTVTLRVKVQHNTGGAFNVDESGTINVDGDTASLNIGTPSATTSSFDDTHSIVTVSVPFEGHGIQSGGIGTISIPLTSSSLIQDADTHSQSPVATTTKLQAKAQVYRYVLWANYTGGSSGQAELRGNDAVVSLGTGFTNDYSDQAGTYMHELGHLLNLKHGGDSNENCIPIYPSIMTYSRQTDSLLGSNWILNYSGLSGYSIDESNLDETGAGFDFGGIYIVWGTPGQNPAYKTGIANGNDLDWNGDGALDSTTPGDSFDVNDLGFSGCNTSRESTLSAYNDWENLDFDFRQGPAGSFDGSESLDFPHPSGIPEQDLSINQQIAIANANYTGPINPPEDNGVHTRNPGSNLPLKFSITDSSDNIIDFASASAWYIVTFDEDGDGLFDEDPVDSLDNDGDGLVDEDDVNEPEPVLIGNFEWQGPENLHYQLGWQTPNTQGLYGIFIILDNPGHDPNKNILFDDRFPHYIGENQVTMLVTLE
jgi:hypothetical protein